MKQGVTASKPDVSLGFAWQSRAWDAALDCWAARIQPGEFYITSHHEAISTVLGSCISACIRDPRRGIGGMNHFMLPDSRPDEGDPVSLSARYGAFAMEVLINSLISLGAQRTQMEAKLFGGGNVLPGMTMMNIGQRNADFAIQFLNAEKIRVVASDLIVYFFPKTGRVLLKKLRNIHNDTIYKREIEYSSRLVKEEVAGDVELFG